MREPSFENRREKRSFEQGEDTEATTLAKRVRWGLSKLFRIETQGVRNLKDIPPGKRIIFLTTHMSDHDVPLAIAGLANDFPRLKVVEASTHEKFSQNPAGYLGRRIGGVENSFSVDYTGGPEGDGKGIFNPDNYEPIKQTLEEGNQMVVAAYFDSKYQDKEWRIPKRGGNGGVYLAQITPDSIIVPVAIDIHSEKPFGMGEPGIGQIIKERRPKVEVKVGRPLDPNKIEGIERFREILHKRKNKELLTTQDREDFKRIREALQAESGRVMAALAELLPQEKRPKD